jgi:hypothetical protein
VESKTAQLEIKLSRMADDAAQFDMGGGKVKPAAHRREY